MNTNEQLEAARNDPANEMCFDVFDAQQRSRIMHDKLKAVHDCMANSYGFRGLERVARIAKTVELVRDFYDTAKRLYNE